jgi:Zn-dependent peptidase ImmA (M78 family)
MSSFVPRKRPTDRDRLNATIYIHEHANKHLARVCIAHEIYHLTLELDRFVRSARKSWPKIPLDRTIEDMCNHFAWELCRLHDLFNKNEDERKKHIFFPDDTFKQPFKMSDSKEWSVNWPDGFALDTENPFWK